MPQIVVENLVKTYRVAERKRGTWGAVKGLFGRRYRTVHALNEVSFTMESGELVGYIGPNGAGKSTTVKILAGILVPDSGRVEVMGRVPWKERIETVRRIGVVFGQKTQLWWDLPVGESFDLLRDIYKVPRGEHKRTREELIVLLELESFLDVPVRQLSLGQRMRCELAASLIHSPDLLYLDEPTIGLDAVSKLAVRDFVRRRNRERGITMILTTHDMDDIEALCTRVVLIHQGRLLFDGRFEDLCARVSRERVLTVDLAEPDAAVGDPDAISVTRTGHRVSLRFDPGRVSAAELIRRVTARWTVNDLVVESIPVEETVAKLYRGLSDGSL